MAPVAPRSSAHTGRLARDAPTTDGAKTTTKIFAAGGERHDRHDLGGRSDDEASIARSDAGLASQLNRDAAQRAIVHVERARPGDLFRVEIERVAVEHVRVHHGRKEIVCGGDGMEVAMKMQIDFLAGLDLRVPAARSAALQSEDGAQRWLARGENGFPANLLQALGEANRDDGLAFAAYSWRGRGDKNEFAAHGKFRIAEKAEPNFGAVGSDGFVVLFRQRKMARDFADG